MSEVMEDTTPTVLVCHPRQVARRALATLLAGCKEGWRVELASDTAEAEAHSGPAVVLVSRALADAGLVEALRTRHPLQLHHIILLTDGKGPAPSASVDELLRTPIVPVELASRVRTGVRLVELRSQLREAQARLCREAVTDELTGLANRQRALSMLRSELARAQRSLQSLAVLLLDVDGLGIVNAQHGHERGDTALADIARAMHQTARKYDLVARWEGQRFLVICPGNRLEGGYRAAQRQRQAIKQLTWRGEGGRAFWLTASVGVAVAARGSALTSRELVARGEAALAEAKRRGGDKVVASEDSVQCSEEVMLGAL